MRRFLIVLILITCKLSAISQSALPDNFKIGDYVEVFSKDSIKIYFNCTGVVMDKQCASYYRVGKMDDSIINITGDFCDYYLEGNIYCKATMRNNKLEGAAHYYHKNGKVSEEGTYVNNLRQGKWTFYYPNGNIEKVYNYTAGEPIVLEAHNNNGKATVVNGNGYFKTDFSTYKQCEKFNAAGKLINGKKNGDWTFTNPESFIPITTETYKDGIFVKGISNGSEYTDKPTILLTNFYANENLTIIDNFPKCGADTYYWLYDQKDLHESFYPVLQEELNKYNMPSKDQWLVIGIKINKNSELETINVASSINDTSIENYAYNLLSKMTKWKTAVVDSRKTESDIFFTVLVEGNQVIIPTDYFYHHRNITNATQY
jgi:antitoxin component YwqK of YwqJK toxin-antitoxin module